MQDRFTMFRRGEVFYYEDRETGRQKSLKTRDASEARRFIQAKNDSVNLPQMNLAMAARTHPAAQAMAENVKETQAGHHGDRTYHPAFCRG